MRKSSISRSLEFSLNTKDLKRQFEQTAKNLKVSLGIIATTAARAVAYAGIDMLARSQPTVPYKTGKLRESGRVYMTIGKSTFVIAEGMKDGSISADISRINKSSVLTGGKLPSRFGVQVGYNRFSKKGFDVTEFTHEVIYPYGSGGKPAARMPNTGPFYLKRVYNQYKAIYEDMIQRSIMDAGFKNIKAGIKTIKAKRGKYDVNLVEVVHRDYYVRSFL